MDKLQINKKSAFKLVFIIFGTSITLLLSACSFLPKEEEVLAPPLVEPATVDYNIAEVQKGEIIHQLTGIANFVPATSENLTYKQDGGRLDQVLIAAGDVVEEGQLLVELESGNLAFDLEQLQLEYEKSKLRIEQLQAQQADSYSIQMANLDKKGLELRLTHMKEQLASSQIKSPMDGIVTFVTDVKPGEFVEPFQSMVQIADTSNLQLIYSAPTASDLDDITFGMDVAITINKEQLKGKVAQTPDTVPDEMHQQNPDLYESSLIISIDTPPDNLTIGGSAEIEVVIAKKEDTLIIPKNGLRTSFGRNYVQILQDNSKREIDIETGIVTSTEVEILKGLNEGEQVILK